MQIAKSASKKLGVLLRCQRLFSSEQLLQLHKGLSCPCIRVLLSSGGSSSTYLLDRIESDLLTLPIWSQTSTCSNYAIKLALSLFYRYYFSVCSHELAACLPPSLARPPNTQVMTLHDYCVAIGNSRVSRDDCFFPSTTKLWNSTFSCLSKQLWPSRFQKAEISVFFTASSKTQKLFPLSSLFSPCSSFYLRTCNL